MSAQTRWQCAANNEKDKIELPQDITSTDDLEEQIFSTYLANCNYEGTKNWTILMPKNIKVAEQQLNHRPIA